MASRDVAAAELILLIIRRIDTHLAELGREGFLVDDNAQDATAFRLLHIGEALKRLRAHPAAARLNLERAVAMRHRLAHDYLGIDPSIVWDTALGELPALAELCRSVIADADTRS